MEEAKRILGQREALWGFILAIVAILWSVVGIYLPQVKLGDLSLRGWWYMVGWGFIFVLGVIYLIIVEAGERAGPGQSQVTDSGKGGK